MFTIRRMALDSYVLMSAQTKQRIGVGTLVRFSV